MASFGTRLIAGLALGLPFFFPSGLLGNEDDFRLKVAPILARRCLSCHNDGEPKGKLSIQTAASFLAGGESGEIVEPGDPDSSYLIELITPQDGEAEMPKDADPLAAEQLQAIRDWIAAGAHWPAGFRIEEARVTDTDWWSLRRLVQPEPPLAELLPKDQQRVQTPIDIFVLAKLREKGLHPSERADRKTLVRRLYFDLIGLPPTPEQVERFLADTEPRAYERLVEELLESPRYGERWARQWLDVVQYGDTHGYDKDKPRPNAWPYRDYVIRAFNEDKPYARFVEEQIAGDVLWPEAADGMVATGFLSAGPWDLIGHAEVPESKIDGKVARNLDRDNMVSSTMNTFASLTVQCSRCHNHKFDPVTMEDYYSLQAVFASIDRADRKYDVDPKVASRRQQLRLEQEASQAQIAELDRQIEEQKPPRLRELEKQAAELQSRLARSSDDKGRTRSNAYGYHSQVAKTQETLKWVQVDLGKPITIDHVALFGADEYGFADFGFPERFRIEISETADFAAPTLLADHTAADFPRPGAAPALFAAKGTTGRYVRVTATRLWNRHQADQPLSGDWIFALGELAVLSDGQIAPVQEVTSLDSIESAPRWARADLIDGVYGKFPLESLAVETTASPTNGYHSQFALDGNTAKWVQIDLGAVQPIETIRLVPAFPTDWRPDTPGFGFPVRFKLEVADEPEFLAPRTIADHTESDYPNPGNEQVAFQQLDIAGRYVRLTATRLWDRGENQHALAMAEIQVESQGANIAAAANVTSLDSIDSGRWHTKYLVDGFASRSVLARPADVILALASPKKQQEELAKLTAELEALSKEAIDSKLLAMRKQLAESQSATNQALAALPPQQTVYSGMVHHGSGAFRGRGGLGPREIHVLLRGEVTKPDKRVEPGTVPLIAGVAARFELPDDHEEGARRVALAHWLTRDDNPLTWRSLVNRIWLYHFGSGICDSPNDFGRGGQLPTHPELLDWLAAEFRDGGQSIKALHRLICNSATYQQSSSGDSQRALVDANNQFLWRMNRRRLTAEEVRDSVLQVTGRLDTKMGGPGFQDFVIDQPAHSPHYEYHKYDPRDATTHRRAVYRFIVRSQPQPFMNTLDCADPSMSVPKRDETLTALQALSLLNNQFIVSMSEEFALRLQRDAKSLDDQIHLAFQLTMARQPTDAEKAALLSHAQEFGLANACRAIINLNEFIFID